MTEETEEKSLSTWARLRQNRLFRWSTDIAIFAAIFLGIMYVQTRHHIGSGEAAPAFRLPALSGDTYDLSDFEGKPTILFFWAPWCGVCKADAHNISALRDAYDGDVNVASVALDYRSLDAVRGFVDDNGVTGPVLLGDRTTSDDYNVDAFPTVYLLDSGGSVASSTVGYTTEWGLRARVLWLSLFD